MLPGGAEYRPVADSEVVTGGHPESVELGDVGGRSGAASGIGQRNDGVTDASDLPDDVSDFDPADANLTERDPLYDAESGGGSWPADCWAKTRSALSMINGYCCDDMCSSSSSPDPASSAGPDPDDRDDSNDSHPAIATARRYGRPVAHCCARCCCCCCLVWCGCSCGLPTQRGRRPPRKSWQKWCGRFTLFTVVAAVIALASFLYSDPKWLELVMRPCLTDEKVSSCPACVLLFVGFDSAPHFIHRSLFVCVCVLSTDIK